MSKKALNIAATQYVDSKRETAYVKSCRRVLCSPDPVSTFPEYNRILYSQVSFYTIKADGTEKAYFGESTPIEQAGVSFFPAHGIMALDRINKRIWTWNHNLSPNLFVYRLYENSYDYLGGYENGFSSGYPPNLVWNPSENCLYLGSNFLGGFSANILKLDEDFNVLNNPWINMNHIFDIWSNGLGSGSYGMVLKDGLWHVCDINTPSTNQIAIFQNIQTLSATIPVTWATNIEGNSTIGWVIDLLFSEWDRKWYFTREFVTGVNQIWRCDEDFTNPIMVLDVLGQVGVGLTVMTNYDRDRQLYFGTSVLLDGEGDGIYYFSTDVEDGDLPLSIDDLTKIPNISGGITNIAMWNLDEE